MKHIFTIVYCLGFILMMFSTGWPQNEHAKPRDISSFYANSWAVVIGINTYQHFPWLDYAVNDAKAVEARLKSMGFNVISLREKQATRANILHVLKEELPQKVQQQDRLMIFYAGHGAAGVLPSGEKVGFIIPSDGKSSVDGRDLEIIGGELVIEDYATFPEKAHYISVDDIRDISDTVSAKHILYILDGCYSGFLDPAVYGKLQPFRRMETRITPVQPTETTRGLKLDEDEHQQSSQKSLHAQSDDYLDVFTSRDTVQVLTAGSSGELVYEKSGHGLFTHYLLKGLDGAADIAEGARQFDDCAVTLSELGNYLKRKVPEASNFSQSPLFNRIGGEGEFIFIPPKCQPVDEIDQQSPLADTSWSKTDAYQGPKSSRYKTPTQVLVDSNDRLFVLDTSLKRIFTFDAEGTYIPSLFDEMSVEKEWVPTSIALGYGETLWVYYSWQGKKGAYSGRISVYKQDGTPAVGWDGQTELTACERSDAVDIPFPLQGLLALDIEDNLIIVDQERGIMTKCDRNGKLLHRWGKTETDEFGEDVSQFKTVTHPQGLAVDMFGYIYVADTEEHRIRKYYEGAWIPSWPGGKGDKPYLFNSPHGLAVDRKFHVYVADTRNHRIKKYTSGGEKLLTFWGKKNAKKGKKYGEFNAPTGVTVNHDNTVVYVADTGNRRVQKFLLISK
jgi:DNA-binding beta-propeller fold protein YncE